MGGKLTTARQMAERVVNLVIKRIGGKREFGISQTHKLAIGGTKSEINHGFTSWALRCPELKEYFEILFKRYGMDAHGICEATEKIYLGKNCDSRMDLASAEIQYLCQNELVCTVEDLFERRMGYLHWSKKKRLARLRYSKQIIQLELGLDELEFKQQYENYQHYLAKFHSIPAVEKGKIRPGYQHKNLKRAA